MAAPEKTMVFTVFNQKVHRTVDEEFTEAKLYAKANDVETETISDEGIWPLSSMEIGLQTSAEIEQFRPGAKFRVTFTPVG